MKDLEMLKKLKKQAAVLGLASTALLGGCTADNQQDKQEPEMIMEEVQNDNTNDGEIGNSINRKELQAKGLDFVFNYDKYERTKISFENGKYEYSDWEKKGSYTSYIYETDTDTCKHEISSITFVEYMPAENGEILAKILVDNEWFPVRDSDLVITNNMLLKGDDSKNYVVKYGESLANRDSLDFNDLLKKSK